MDLKFIKTSNRLSFLSIKLLFSGFQISFPMFLNNLLCKKNFLLQLQSTFNVFMSEVKLLINFQKCYQKNENVLWKARYIKVSILFI